MCLLCFVIFIFNNRKCVVNRVICYSYTINFLPRLVAGGTTAYLAGRFLVWCLTYLELIYIILKERHT
ncbi:unnamed protein product [Callosobruchus maculatus]|uniref:Uncharacterized protein n=1 Tax=Callosobruchus maculatus TaxID=64391 RepID=A0A653C7K7_CALMS|nr:unnamed protein product [Callosobruchus maculatus]